MDLLFKSRLSVKKEREKNLKCVVCTRETDENRFCSLHQKAYRNIKQKFDSWKNAITISWEEYLSEIMQNPLTGEWIKEVASYLFANGAS